MAGGNNEQAEVAGSVMGLKRMHVLSSKFARFARLKKAGRLGVGVRAPPQGKICKRNSCIMEFICCEAKVLLRLQLCHVTPDAKELQDHNHNLQVGRGLAFAQGGLGLLARFLRVCRV